MTVLAVGTAAQLIVLFLLVRVVFRHLFSPLSFITRGLLFWVPLVEKLGSAAGIGSSRKNGISSNSGTSSQGLRNRNKKQKKSGRGSTESRSTFPIGLRQRELTDTEIVELAQATEVELVLQAVVCAVVLFVCAQVTSCVFVQVPHINLSIVVLAVTVLMCLLFLARDLLLSDWPTVRRHTAVFIVAYVVLMFCLQLPASLLELHIREAVPVLRGRFLNIRTSLNQNASILAGVGSTHDRRNTIEAVKVAAQVSGEAYDDVTDMEWMFVSSCFAFVGASIAGLMLKPARLSAIVFRHATGKDNVRVDNWCTRASAYIGFFVHLPMAVCWIPPLTANMLLPLVNECTWHSIRTGLVICGCIYRLTLSRDQLQMYLDEIRPRFANLASIKGKLSASQLIEFVLHRVRSICPVVLALISVGVVPMCLAMILKNVAGIKFVEIGDLRVCATSTSKESEEIVFGGDGASNVIDIDNGEKGMITMFVQNVLGYVFDGEQLARLKVVWKSSSIGFVMHPILEPFLSFLLFVVIGSVCILEMFEAATII